MGFWVRKVIIASVLVITAYILLANQDSLMSLFGEKETQVEEAASTSNENITNTNKENTGAIKPAPAKQKKKSANAAAEGLSRFYASINPEFSEGNGPRIKNNIVYLEKPKGDLTKILEAKKMVSRPLRQSWKGNRENRAFRKGQTLYQKLSEYVQAEGVEVIWWLDRDFVVKDPFRIEKDILKTSYQIGKAISGHFENGVDIFFCNKHRAIVITDTEKNFLSSQCRILGSQQSAW